MPVNKQGILVQKRFFDRPTARVKGRPRGAISAHDAIVRELLDRIEKSGRSDMEILGEAELSDHALHRLRNGSRSGRLSTIASLAGAVGLRLRLEEAE